MDWIVIYGLLVVKKGLFWLLKLTCDLTDI